MVLVQLFATYRDIAGTKEMRLGAASVGGVLASLRESVPALYAELCTPDGTPRPLVKILVNGRHIEFLSGLETPVGEKDTIALFPPLAGG